jgi:hypothetical protein
VKISFSLGDEVYSIILLYFFPLLLKRRLLSGPHKGKHGLDCLCKQEKGGSQNVDPQLIKHSTQRHSRGPDDMAQIHTSKDVSSAGTRDCSKQLTSRLRARRVGFDPSTPLSNLFVIFRDVHTRNQELQAGHLVGGQGACLVRADDCCAAQRLYGGKFPAVHPEDLGSRLYFYNDPRHSTRS